MVISTGLCNEQSAEADASKLVGVVDEVVIVVPGDHEDGDLQGELETGLGQDWEGAEHFGLGHWESCLPLADVDQVPDNEAHWEQERAKEEDPEEVDTELLGKATLYVPMDEGVGVAQKLWKLKFKLFHHDSCQKDLPRNPGSAMAPRVRAPHQMCPLSK